MFPCDLQQPGKYWTIRILAFEKGLEDTPFLSRILQKVPAKSFKNEVIATGFPEILKADGSRTGVSIVHI